MTPKKRYRPAPRRCVACWSSLLGTNHGRACSQSECGWRWSRSRGWKGPKPNRYPRSPVAVERVESTVPRCPTHGLQLERKFSKRNLSPFMACPVDSCKHTADAPAIEIPSSYAWEYGVT
jgi:hypothetical protein